MSKRPKPAVMRLLAAARQHHEAGDLDVAERIYHEVLRQHRGEITATHLLGLIRSQRGAYEQALELMEQSIRAAPHIPEFHNNIGEVYRAIGKPVRAVA